MFAVVRDTLAVVEIVNVLVVGFDVTIMFGPELTIDEPALTVKVSLGVVAIIEEVPLVVVPKLADGK